MNDTPPSREELQLPHSQTNQTMNDAPIALDRQVLLSDEYWLPWFATLLELADLHGIVTSDDADLWWDDFGAGKTPQESMDEFLASDEGAAFRNNYHPRH
jgi:hypothetical protein